jgi:hypothetical protein
MQVLNISVFNMSDASLNFNSNVNIFDMVLCTLFRRHAQHRFCRLLFINQIKRHIIPQIDLPL